MRTQTRNYTRRRKRGGSRLHRIFDFSEAHLLGVGGFGIALSHVPNNAVKLLYDVDQCKALIEEAQLQIAAKKLLDAKGIPVRVPRISAVLTEPVVWKGTPYLCGIAMERVQPPHGFTDPVHIILGEDDSDLNQHWGKTISKPVGPNNPSRGFFASGDFLEDLWESEGRLHTVESVAYTMGVALRALVDGGIVPVDLEWIYGGDGNIHLIDFGLCRFGRVDPTTFFYKKGREGPASEIYNPHEGDYGWPEFVEGYFGKHISYNV